ncbi:hypothetical protein M918_07575 [Clostridium sp. BL8]|nr:hypothetical protein M918_07575 [Clostridium sp. BL8]
MLKMMPNPKTIYDKYLITSITGGVNEGILLITKKHPKRIKRYVICDKTVLKVIFTKVGPPFIVRIY